MITTAKVKLATNIVDPTGGANKIGFIGGISLIQEGEALGHDLWIDSIFIDQLIEQLTAMPTGLKCKLMHSSIFTDSIGTFLGKIVNPRKEGINAVGDLSFALSSTKTRYGNLADYICTLTKENPEAFGASLEFDLNVDEMILFIKSRSGEAMINKSGELDVTGFVSPDPKNVKNLPHARLHAVTSVALVDEPAANPDGIFASKRLSTTDSEVQAIAAVICQEIEGKKNFGILNALKTMNIELAKKTVVDTSTSETEITKYPEAGIEIKVDSQENQVTTVEDTANSSVTETVITEKTVITETVAKQPEPTAPTPAPAPEMPSEAPTVDASAKVTHEQFAALTAELNKQRAELASLKELKAFASGAVPVPPVVEIAETKTEGIRERFAKALKPRIK